MVEGAGGGGPEVVPGPKPTSSYEASGERFRFTVELRPEETTIVSWKKLLREATSSNPNGSAPSVSRAAASEANHQPVSQPTAAPSPSKQPEGNEVTDSQAQAGPNRLSNVIEKIERMYAGNSSEEEDAFLDDIPDDDEYDTDDSFIDDAELDDYFQVDNSAIKHDGFFVNRGKLERVESSVTTNQQPKKRKRKDVAKGQSGNNDIHNPHKLVKTGNKGRKVSSQFEKNSTSQLHRVTAPDLLTADVPSPTNGSESLKKRTEDTHVMMNPSNVEGIRQDKDADQQITGVLSSEDHNKKLKGSSELQHNSAQRSNDKSLSVSTSHSGKQLSNVDELDQSIQRKEKDELVERFDLSVPASRSPQILKAPTKKEVSNVRSKVSLLEKAFRELEKIVAESRPPLAEVQDPDHSSQTVKRRLPQDIKQKLAKVARLAQASYGKIPKDVTNRLNSIVGHLMQLRTLKRNLKIMANLGLSAKQEKDDRLQKIKQEVADMVRQRVPYIKSKLEQQTSSTDDFQEAAPEEKEALKLKYSLDEALENKISELYDLYVERLEEDSGPPVRRLYEELASFWPSGLMDTNGIKRAIYKAKDRRKALLSSRRKDKEKIKKRKVLAQKTDDIQGPAVNRDPELKNHEKALSDSNNQGTACVPVVNAPNTDKLKLDRIKGVPKNKPLSAVPMDVLPKKKLKRKSNTDIVETQKLKRKSKTDIVETQSQLPRAVASESADPLHKPNIQPA